MRIRGAIWDVHAEHRRRVVGVFRAPRRYRPTKLRAAFVRPWRPFAGVASWDLAWSAPVLP